MWHEQLATVAAFLADNAPSPDPSSPVTGLLIVTVGGALSGIVIALIQRGPRKRERKQDDEPDLDARILVLEKFLSRRGVKTSLIVTGEERDDQVL